jgi:antitoxin PrlF
MKHMTNVATVSEKGQITIPKDLRDDFGIGKGDRLEFSAERDGIKIRKRVNVDALESLRGSIKLPASVDELIDEMRGGPAKL